MKTLEQHEAQLSPLLVTDNRCWIDFVVRAPSERSCINVWLMQHTNGMCTSHYGLNRAVCRLIVLQEMLHFKHISSLHSCFGIRFCFFVWLILCGKLELMGNITSDLKAKTPNRRQIKTHLLIKKIDQSWSLRLNSKSHSDVSSQRISSAELILPRVPATVAFHDGCNPFFSPTYLKLLWLRQ